VSRDVQGDVRAARAICGVNKLIHICYLYSSPDAEVDVADVGKTTGATTSTGGDEGHKTEDGDENEGKEHGAAKVGGGALRDNLVLDKETTRPQSTLI
jgi:hypothetical protein